MNSHPPELVDRGDPVREARTLIVILNYNAGELVIEGLRALEPELAALPNAEVVVADNASPDGSGARIAAAIERRGWASWARLEALPRNGGFAYGNNAIIRAALASPEPPDFVLLLNPDTAVRPGAITALLTHATAHPEAGIVGSRLEDPDGTPQYSAFRFPSVATELESTLQVGLVTRLLDAVRIAPPPSDERIECDWVAGASMLVRREVFETIGLMDEEYFLYFEEVDFCLRSKKAGFRCEYLPSSRVVHLVGQSTGVTDTRKKPTRRPAYWFESRRRYFLKHHGLGYAALADLAWTAAFAAHSVRRVALRRPRTDPPKMLRDFLSHSVWFGGHR